MLVLALESSAAPASAAVLEDGKLLGEFFVNTRQTHSQTLLPMVEHLLSSLQKKPEDFDLMAVSSGPGSFTGVRIGVSALKGLAMPFHTPCCGVSTLETIAWGQRGLEGKVICAVMDARCRQVYHGMFQIRGGKPVRLCEDQALSIEELFEAGKTYGSSLILAGDGASICYETFSSFGALLAPEPFRFQRAAFVGLAAMEENRLGRSCSPGELLPRYLRLPQAQRELKSKLERNEKV